MCILGAILILNFNKETVGSFRERVEQYSENKVIKRQSTRARWPQHLLDMQQLNIYSLAFSFDKMKMRVIPSPRVCHD